MLICIEMSGTIPGLRLLNVIIVLKTGELTVTKAHISSRIAEIDEIIEIDRIARLRASEIVKRY